MTPPTAARAEADPLRWDLSDLYPADDDPQLAADLEAATAAAEARDWPAVIALVTAITLDERADRRDRAEAHRLRGLAAFAGGDQVGAETHFLAYLKLDLDGALDPVNDTPEAIAFFAGVKQRHAAELRALRPRPRASFALNLLPPAGQFQNREPTKAWVLAAGGTALLATNLGTYVALRRWCDEADDTCGDHTDGARIVRAVNLVSGAALIGLYLYGVYDGVKHYRRTPRAGVAPLAFSTAGGGGLGISGGF